MEIEAKMSDATIEENESNVKEAQDDSSNISIEKSKQEPLEEGNMEALDLRTDKALNSEGKSISNLPPPAPEPSTNTLDEIDHVIGDEWERIGDEWHRINTLKRKIQTKSHNVTAKKEFTENTVTTANQVENVNQPTILQQDIVPQNTETITQSTQGLQKTKAKIYRKCKLCWKSIKRIYLKRHMKDIHSGRKYPCCLCYSDFSRRETLHRHIDNIHKHELNLVDDKRNAKFSKKDCKIMCKNCNKKFISEESKNFHNERMHGKGKHKLKRKIQTESPNVTVKRESSENTIISQEESDQSPILQKDMDNIPQNTETITQSTKGLQKAKTYIYRKCQKCQKSIKRIHFNRHMKDIHSGTKHHTCCLCYSSFTRKEHLHRHIDNVHKHELNLVDNERKANFSKDDCKIMCKNCDMKFISEESKNFHNDRIHGTW